MLVVGAGNKGGNLHYWPAAFCSNLLRKSHAATLPRCHGHCPLTYTLQDNRPFSISAGPGLIDKVSGTRFLQPVGVFRLSTSLVQRAELLFEHCLEESPRESLVYHLRASGSSRHRQLRNLFASAGPMARPTVYTLESCTDTGNGLKLTWGLFCSTPVDATMAHLSTRPAAGQLCRLILNIDEKEGHSHLV